MDGELKLPRKFAIFMNNGDVILIDAIDYIWDDDGTVAFYDDKECVNYIATFKQDVIYGVSICNYEIYKHENNNLSLPKYDENTETE